MAKLSRELLRQAMRQMGAKGGKAAAAKMTAAERKKRAAKASKAAAKARAAAARKREK